MKEALLKGKIIRPKRSQLIFLFPFSYGCKRNKRKEEKSKKIEISKELKKRDKCIRNLKIYHESIVES